MSKIVVIGSLNMDHIVHVPHMVKQGETILAKDDLRFVPGGKGANQAYAIGKLGEMSVCLEKSEPMKPEKACSKIF